MAKIVKKIFTTGDIAKICNVGMKAVQGWFDSGRLKGFRIPGSRKRQVPRVYFLRFLEDNNLPFAEKFKEETMAKVLVIADDKALVSGIKRGMCDKNVFKVEVVGNGFDAGYQTAAFAPDCVIVDLQCKDAVQICRKIRENKKLSETIVIALMPSGSPEDFDKSMAIEMCWKPPQAELLAQRVRDLVGATKGLA